MKAITIPFTFVVCAAFSAVHIIVLNCMGVETLNKGKYQIEREFSGLKGSSREEGNANSSLKSDSIKEGTKLQSG